MSQLAVTLRKSILLTKGQPNSLTRLYHNLGKHKINTMDDLPVPKGDWRQNYHNKNSTYNAYLAGAIASNLIVLGMMAISDSVFYNFSPPCTTDD